MKVDKSEIEGYQKYLNEKSRPQSKGDNSKALHFHVLVIDDEK